MSESGLDPLDWTPNSVLFLIDTVDPAPSCGPRPVVTSVPHPTPVPAVIRDRKVGGTGGSQKAEVEGNPVRIGYRTLRAILFSIPVPAAYSMLVPVSQSIKGEEEPKSEL